MIAAIKAISKEKQAYLLLGLAVLFWSGNSVLGRAVRAEIPPVGLAFWRWALATVFILPFAWRYLVNDWGLIKKHFAILLSLSFLGVGSFNTMLYTGLQYTTAVNSVLLQTLLSAIVLLLSRVFFQISIKPLQVLGVIIAFIGASFIIFEGNIAGLLGFSLNPGDVIILVAVVFYAAYTVLLQKRPPIHPLSFIFSTFFLGLLMILPFYLLETFLVRPVSLSPLSALSFLYVAIFPSILAYLFFNRGVALIGANRAGVTSYLAPVFGTLLAVIFLKESFKTFHIIGIGLISAGVFIASRLQKKPRSHSQ